MGACIDSKLWMDCLGREGLNTARGSVYAD